MQPNVNLVTIDDNIEKIKKLIQELVLEPRIKALAEAENKSIKAHQAKIDRINELYHKSEKMQTYLDMEGFNELDDQITPTDWVAVMEHAGTAPTGYIKTALKAPQEGAQAPGQGGYER